MRQALGILVALLLASTLALSQESGPTRSNNCSN